MPQFDVVQPPKIARKKNGITVRATSIPEIFTIITPEKVWKIEFNVIVLMAMHCYESRAYSGYSNHIFLVSE